MSNREVESAIARGEDTLEFLRKRFMHLCDTRDQANALVAPLQTQLDAANLEAERARLKANQIAAQIEAVRGGGENWLKLKREIARLARMISTQ